MQHSLIITGMHRSNTSLVAKAFHQVGLYLGDELMPPSAHNKEGYFEEEKIIALHDRWLRARRVPHWHLRKIAPEFHRFQTEERADAEALLREVYQDQNLFGFKDPRATLFLPFWAELLPHARFVLVYRDPLKTTQSLVKRRDFKKYVYFTAAQAYMALEVWEVYNRYLLDFADAHPEKCVLVHAPADFDEQGTERLNVRLRQTWELPLQPVRFSEAINPKLLRTAPDQAYRWLLRFRPGVLPLYEQLQAHPTNLSLL